MTVVSTLSSNISTLLKKKKKQHFIRLKEFPKNYTVFAKKSFLIIHRFEGNDGKGLKFL